MKFTDALGFFSIGLVMLALPQVGPELCPRNGFDGSSGSELWLYAMGTMQAGLGGAGLAWHGTVVLIAAFETLLATMAEVLRETEAELAWFAAADDGVVEFGEIAGWAERRAA